MEGDLIFESDLPLHSGSSARRFQRLAIGRFPNALAIVSQKAVDRANVHPHDQVEGIRMEICPAEHAADKDRHHGSHEKPCERTVTNILNAEDDSMNDSRKGDPPEHRKRKARNAGGIQNHVDDVVVVALSDTRLGYVARFEGSQQTICGRFL